MTTFKAFLKVLNKCKIPIIIYTIILLFFSVFNMETEDNNINFVATKPDILIVNDDQEVGITKNIIEYFENNCNIVDVKKDEESIKDALFYRDVSLVLYIKEGYREEFLKGNNPSLEIESTGDYESTYATMMLNRYLNTASLYRDTYSDEDEIIRKLNESLKENTEVLSESTLNTDSLSKISFYYNFLSYSMMAGTIYVICLILSSFNNEQIKKRCLASCSSYKKQNLILLGANLLFSIVIWLFYVLISTLLCPDVIFSMHGLIFILNFLIFTLCSVTIAFLISKIISDKNAINGVVNVVALGSSFLCGAFVPSEMLPDMVLKVAHILPSYWYINSNDLLKNMETINIASLKPIFLNIIVMLLFSLVFIILSNLITKKNSST